MPGRNYDKLAAAADRNVKEKEFWLKQLSGEPVKSCFPYDKRNKTATERTMETVPLEFTHGVLSRLSGLSKGSDVKLHMALTAALAALLEKYTGNNDITLGAPIYKQDIEIEFINTILILRARVTENMTFKDLLLQVKQVVVEAVENQNYPPEILLEQLGIPYREGDDFPLFDAAILHENIHHKRYLDNICCNVLFIFNGAGEQVKGVVEYNSALFERTSPERIAGHFQRLLERLAFNVDTPLSGIEIMSEEEKKRVLYDFNETADEFEVKNTIHETFEEQAAKTPDRIAMVGEEFLRDYQLSYRELNERANQLARCLREKGVRPGTIAGLMVEKSLEMMVGIWGILKAGGAYLPIDLTYPRWRIEYMLKESGAVILLTYAGEMLPVEVGAMPGLESINILSPVIYRGDASHLDRVTRVDDPAYIIYTSGSTGKPKGVVVEHGNMAAYVHAFSREFQLGPLDTALQQASYSFDVFVEEVYPVLCVGGKAVICPKYVIMDMGAFHRFILKHGITFISVSPLLLNEIDKLAHTGGIRIFISGGDVLKKEYIENLVKKENVSVYNTYGPTETTVCATYYRCVPGAGENLPIGKPITNYNIYIVDRFDRVLPTGVPGELWISGPGVTRGYLNNPELTDQKFLLDKSFSVDHGGRFFKKAPLVYRTGDLARWLDDGNIEFLGRIDQQVKVRGFRIEAGEIENRLLKYEGIKAALARVKGEGMLCAYIASEKQLTVMELKEYLARHLPDYMVPTHYVILERLPLTAHGKPDMKALEAYKPQTGAGMEYTAPGTDIEIALSSIWKELLNLDKVSIHDNFFDLGGNSMLLLKAANKIKEELKRDIPYVAMFQYTTIHALAGHLNSGVELAGAANPGPGNPGPDKYEAQAGTLEKGKDRMKKFITKSKGVETVSRKNPDYKPDSYPENFPCIMAAIREKLGYENQLNVGKSIFVVGDGGALIELGYKENSDLKEKLKFLEFSFSKKLGIFAGIAKTIGYSRQIKYFSSLEEELNYCIDRLNRRELVLLTGTTYFLDYTPDYHMEQALWLKKMDELFATYDGSSKLDLFGHVFLLVDVVKDNYIVYDTIYNYYGKVPLENLHKAIIGNSAIECSKGHISHDSYRPYQVIELFTEASIRNNEKELLRDIMKKFIGAAISSEVYKRKEYGEEYVAFLGIGALKELVGIIEGSLKEKEPTDDLLRYTTAVIKSWKLKYIFLRDFLLDFTKYFTLPGEILTGIEGTINHWDSLYKQNLEKKDCKEEDELTRLFIGQVEQIEKIYEEQVKIFAGIAQIVEHI